MRSNVKIDRKIYPGLRVWLWAEISELVTSLRSTTIYDDREFEVSCVTGTYYTQVYSYRPLEDYFKVEYSHNIVLFTLCIAILIM